MIRPTFLAFETARRALNVSQAGLDVVGNNIANVNTPGYTRQRMIQHAVSNSFQSQFQVFGARGHFTGQGVDLGGITQIRDPFLDTRFRNEASTNGELAVRQGGLMDLERVIDEISKGGLHASMGELINQISRFAQNADSPEIAVVVRNAAMHLTQVFNRTANDLQGILNAQMFDLEVAITNDVNSAIERIAYLNERIRQDHMFGSPANELQDERNLLIDKLSHFLPIQVVRTPERVGEHRTIERVSINLVGSGGGSINLVDNDRFNILGLTRLEDGRGNAAISLIEGASGFPLMGDITANITSGGIRGFLDIVNGMGDFAGTGENTFRGIPYYQMKLDNIAQTFARQMNLMNSISQAEADRTETLSAQNRPLFTANLPQSVRDDLAAADPDNFDSFDLTSFVTAGNITLSANWMAEASWFTTTKQDPSLPVPVLDSNGNPTFDYPGGNQIFHTPSNTDNILAFVNLLSRDATHFMAINGNGHEVALFRGSFQESFSSMQSTLGLDFSMNQALLGASDLVLGGFSDQRDSISAVSADEEAINMMIFQNHYNAAARFMTTIDEALDMIISRMGLVGR